MSAREENNYVYTYNHINIKTNHCYNIDLCKHVDNFLHKECAKDIHKF